MRRLLFALASLAVGCMLVLPFVLTPLRAEAKCPVKAPSDLLTPGTLTIGTSLGTPPLKMIVDNKPAGSDIEIGEALAGQMCLKPEFVNLAFAGLFPGLNAKKFDIIISAVGITKQREESFDFVPYFLGGIQLMSKKSSGLKVKDEMETCGHSIGSIAGSVEDRDLAKFKPLCPVGKPMDARTFATVPEVIEQLRKGTIDFAFIDWAPAVYAVQQSGGEFMLASPVLSGEPPGEPRHIDGIVTRKGDAEMHQAVSVAFNNLVKNKTYAKILKKWNLEEGDFRKATPH